MVEIPVDTRKCTSEADRLPRGVRLGLVVLILATALAYAPTLTNGFTNWDDDVYVWNNPHMTAPDGLVRIWRTFESPQYYPLTFTGFWIQYQLWGTQAAGYHAVQLVLHLVNVLLVFAFFRRVGLMPWAALIGSALFALHPVQVGSVAWTVELKNVLSTMFYLGTMLTYLRWREAGSRISFVASLLLFVAALLSKTYALTLPASLFALEILVLRQRTPASLARMIPFALFSTAAAAVTVLVEKAGALQLPDLGPRVLLAAAAPWFYLYKLIWPLSLPAVYPRWNVDWTWWPGWIGLPATLLVVVGVFRYRKHIAAPALWGLCHFIISLGPVLGFVGFGYMEKAYVADHFLYLPLIGLCAAFGIYLHRFFERLRQSAVPGVIPIGIVVTLLTAFATKTWIQTGIWKSSETLWAHTLALNPTCSSADNNLGIARMQRGDLDAAREHFERALRNDPNNPRAYNNLGAILVKQKKYADAIARYRQALERNPRYADAHLNLGSALVKVGRIEEAERAFRTAIDLDPYQAQAHHGLGRVMAIRGQWNKAADAYRKALSLRPRYFDALVNLGTALVQLGKHDDARSVLNRALEIRPDSANAHSVLAISMEDKNEFDRAEQHYRKAVELAPDRPRGYFLLGNLYAKRGNLSGAVAQYRHALNIAPDFIDARINLGNAFRGLGQFEAAVGQFQAALQRAPKNSTLLYNLAMTLGEVGQYAQAIQLLQDSLKQSPGRAEFTHGLAWMLATCPDARYRNGPIALKLAQSLARSVKQPRPDLLDLLAAATAETGDYPQAARLARQAAELAERARLGSLAKQIRQRAERYRAGKPYRQPTPAASKQTPSAAPGNLTPTTQSP